jgi:hypothetical protein
MLVSVAFPSKYLKAEDFLLHGEQTLIIAKCYVDEIRMVDGSKKKKLVVEFERTEKQWIPCKTSALSVAALYGPETDDWAGKSINLYSERVTAFGKLVDAIRVHPPGPVKGRVPPSKRGQPAAGAEREPGSD